MSILFGDEGQLPCLSLAKLFNIEYYTTLYLVMNGCSIVKLKTATFILLQ